MIHSKEMTEALNRLSQLANEESTGEDIPTHFISKIISQKQSKLVSAYARNEKFSKNKSFKIENQRRLKFLEELSELREKPSINQSFNVKNDGNLPLYLRADQIVRDRNKSVSAQKSERSRQVLIEEAKIQKKFSPGEGKGDPDFYENLKKWQVKKERNLALGKEKKEEEELKEVKSGPELNEKSMKIVKKLREIQGCSTLSLNRLAIVKRKSALTPPPSFVPAMSEKSKILALNRSGSVFDRLYSYKTPKKVEKSQSPIRKKSKSPSVIGLNRSYSINSGRGIISDKISLVDQIKYEEHMKFLIASLG